MTPQRYEQITGWFAAIAGAADFCTGSGLVVAPVMTLRLMGVPPPDGDLVFLRFLGAFVGAVGFSYLRALWRKCRTGNGALLHATFEITTLFRLAAGAVSTWLIVRGWLAPAWTSVPVTDFLLAGGQMWLLRQGALSARTRE